jgi:hypothetical protein
MTTTLLVLTDGRADCLARTLSSAEAKLPPFDRYVLVNDCPDPAYGAWLAERWPYFEVIPPQRRKRGFGGAIQAGWDAIGPGDGDVFHLEDDFTFDEPPPLDLMARLLDRHLHIAQVCLVRQPWNEEERAAGGIIAANPDDYIERDDPGIGRWVEHRRCFSTNPCMYRRSLLRVGWPEGSHSEGVFTHRLLERGWSFAYWGERGAQQVTHIGDVRTGVGY